MAASVVKEVCEDGSNGDNGGVDGRGGVAACEGAFRLQSAHPSLTLRMSFDIPGQ